MASETVYEMVARKYIECRKKHTLEHLRKLIRDEKTDMMIRGAFQANLASNSPKQRREQMAYLAHFQHFADSLIMKLGWDDGLTMVEKDFVTQLADGTLFSTNLPENNFYFC